jgi:acetyl esterase/lipase
MLAALLLALAATGLPAAAEAPVEQTAPEEVDHLMFETAYLWDGPAPNAKGDGAEDRPRLYVLPPDPEKATGASVIVCPGGGYGIRSMDHEGLQVCRWLNRVGVTAFLLCYRIRSQGYEPDDAFIDAARAVRYVRSHAEDYGVAPHRIGMIGFSAGAHLISRLALEQDAGQPEADDPVERESNQPDFLILCYGAAHVPEASEDAEGSAPGVAADMPPTFIFHTSNDETVDADGVIAWYQAMRAAGVEAEMHIFGGYGPHGSGLTTGDPATRVWPDLAAAWMRRSGLLTDKERASVEGMIRIDGEPVYIAWATFIPQESEADPAAAGMVVGWVEMGRYQIPAEQGPTPGLHRVEVRHVAREMMLTEPVLEDEVLYTKFSPSDPGPMMVRIEPGSNVIDIDISTGTTESVPADADVRSAEE